MYGIAAIEQANGWAQAGAGACIVIAGLAVLSFLISLLPKVITLFEDKPKPSIEPVKKAPPEPKMPERLPEDINAAATLVISLTEEIGEDFSLVDLHCKCKEIGLANPHMSIKHFRDAGILAPIGEGRFCWQPLSE